MASSETTQNYHLSKWIPEDRPKRIDFVNDNVTLDELIKQLNDRIDELNSHEVDHSDRVNKEMAKIVESYNAILDKLPSNEFVTNVNRAVADIRDLTTSFDKLSDKVNTYNTTNDDLKNFLNQMKEELKVYDINYDSLNNTLKVTRATSEDNIKLFTPQEATDTIKGLVSLNTIKNMIANYLTKDDTDEDERRIWTKEQIKALIETYTNLPPDQYQMYRIVDLQEIIKDYVEKNIPKYGPAGLTTPGLITLNEIGETADRTITGPNIVDKLHDVENLIPRLDVDDQLNAVTRKNYVQNFVSKFDDGYDFNYIKDRILNHKADVLKNAKRIHDEEYNYLEIDEEMINKLEDLFRKGLNKQAEDIVYKDFHTYKGLNFIIDSTSFLFRAYPVSFYDIEKQLEAELESKSILPVADEDKKGIISETRVKELAGTATTAAISNLGNVPTREEMNTAINTAVPKPMSDNTPDTAGTISKNKLTEIIQANAPTPATASEETKGLIDYPTVRNVANTSIENKWGRYVTVAPLNTGINNVVTDAKTGYVNMAIGVNNSITNTDANYSAAVGASNTINGHASFIFGDMSNISKDYAISLGHSNRISQTFGIAIGTNANVGAFHGIAIGYNTKANSSYSVAIGNDSTASESYTVSFGNVPTTGNPTYRRLVNVKEARDDHDVVIKSQLTGLTDNAYISSEFNNHVLTLTKNNGQSDQYIFDNIRSAEKADLFD